MLYGSFGAGDRLTYAATRCIIKKGSTSRPAVKSTKAKAVMKYEAGARKHSRGSRVNGNSTLLVIVIGDRIARQKALAC